MFSFIARHANEVAMAGVIIFIIGTFAAFTAGSIITTEQDEKERDGKISFDLSVLRWAVCNLSLMITGIGFIVISIGIKLDIFAKIL